MRNPAAKSAQAQTSEQATPIDDADAQTNEAPKKRHFRLGVESFSLLGNYHAILDAVDYCHSHGVIHRDPKPQNVGRGEFGETVVFDFGIALRLLWCMRCTASCGGACASRRRRWLSL